MDIQGDPACIVICHGILAIDAVSDVQELQIAFQRAEELLTMRGGPAEKHDIPLLRYRRRRRSPGLGRDRQRLVSALPDAHQLAETAAFFLIIKRKIKFAVRKS